MTPLQGTAAVPLRFQVTLPDVRLPEILGELMGLAIALVVLQYAGGMLGWSPDFHFGVGIEILFILTGAALALGHPDSQPAIGRMARIVPAYWVVLTLYTISNIHFLQLHYTTFNLAIHYLGIQGCFGDGYALAIDEPLCLVALILAFSLWYWFGSASVRQPDRWLLVAGACSVPLACAYYFHGQAGSFSYLGQPLPSFFAGVLLGRLLRTGTVDFRLGPVLAVAAALLTYVPFTQGVLFTPVLAGLSVMGLYVFAWKRLAAAGLEKLASRLLRFIGAYWVEILLIHQPLIREYNYYLEGRWFGIGAPTTQTLVIGIAIGLTVTLAASILLRRLLRKLPSPFSPSS